MENGDKDNDSEKDNDNDDDDEMYDDEDEETGDGEDKNKDGKKDGEGDVVLKEHFLLSMREPTKNVTLFGAARERGDANLEKTLSKYIVTNELINQKLNRYGDYISETFAVLRKEFTTVKLFVF